MLQPRLLSQQAVVLSLEVARMMFHCNSIFFVVSNYYNLFSSSETYWDVSSVTNPSAYVVTCWYSPGVQDSACVPLFRGKDYSCCKPQALWPIVTDGFPQMLLFCLTADFFPWQPGVNGLYALQAAAVIYCGRQTQQYQSCPKSRVPILTEGKIDF